MRILFVITGLGLGGAETQLASLSGRLVARGHAVMIVYLTGTKVVSGLDSRILLCAAEMDRTMTGAIRGLLSLRKAVSSFQPDVVHSHMLHANLLSRLLRIAVPIPRLISTVHSKIETHSRLLQLAYRLTDRLADFTTFVSIEAAECYLAKGLVTRRRALPVYNGIDVDRFSPQAGARDRVRTSFNLDSNVKLLIAVGRLVRSKDYPNMIRAFSKVARSETSVVLLIIGDGVLRQELESTCVHHGISDRVVFAGTRSDIPDLLSAADVFVLSSECEGFGLAVGEAMACELLAVATDSGGVREAVGDAGLLVPPGDDDALASCLLRAFTMPERERRSMGSAARRRIASLYSLDQAIDRWELLYQGGDAK